MLTSRKSRRNGRTLVMICSCMVVILLIVNVFSTKSNYSVKRRRLKSALPFDKLVSISMDINKKISNENRNYQFAPDVDDVIINNINHNDDIEADFDGNVNPGHKIFTSKNRPIWTSPPTDILLSKQQIAAITKVLPVSGNLFVWGLGNDSPFWHDSTKGKVVFIEPEGDWLKNITSKYPYLETYQVNYTTLLYETFDKYINNSEIWSDLDLCSQLPPFVTHTPWDVILVDAPSGFEAEHPGRYQSLYTSSLIAQNGTHIFVDDFDRRVEREFSLKMLGTPIEVVNRPTVENVTKASELAHFIHTDKQT